VVSRGRNVYRILLNGKVQWVYEVSYKLFGSHSDAIKWHGISVKSYDENSQKKIEQFYQDLLYKKTDYESIPLSNPDPKSNTKYLIEIQKNP
jgi:hypothetical protein